MPVTQAQEAGPITGAHLTEVLDSALAEVDADETSGSLLRATGLRVCFEIPDVGCVLNVESVDAGDHHIRWGYGRGPWSPRLRIRFDSEVANRYLQGRENLAIAVARGRVRVEGDPRFTLLYLPALRVLMAPYRRAVEALCPDMEID